MKLNSETVIRWRYVRDQDGNIKLDENGQPMKESNAHFVRWNDGSLHLVLGGTEVLNVEQQPLSQAHQQLFAKTQTSLIQCHGQLESKLIFTPCSLKSKAHQKLALSIIEKHKEKERKVILVTTSVDPDKEKADKEKMEEERIKATKHLLKNQRKTEQSFNVAYLEQDEYRSDEDYKVPSGRGRQRRRESEDWEDERRILSAKNETVKSKSNRGVASRKAKPTKPKRPSRREEDEDEMADFIDDAEIEEEIVEEEEDIPPPDEDDDVQIYDEDL